MREVSEAAAMARSLIHKRVRQLRASAVKPSLRSASDKNQKIMADNTQQTAVQNHENPTTRNSSPVKVIQQPSKGFSSLFYFLLSKSSQLMIFLFYFQLTLPNI